MDAAEAAVWAAGIGVVGTLIGTLGGSALTRYFDLRRSREEREHGQSVRWDESPSRYLGPSCANVT